MTRDVAAAAVADCDDLPCCVLVVVVVPSAFEAVVADMGKIPPSKVLM